MSVALTGPIRQGLDNKWHLLALTVLTGLALGALVVLKPILGLALPLAAILCLVIIPRPKLGLYLIAAWLPFESLAGFGSDFSATKLLAIVTFLGWSLHLYKTKHTHINLNEKTHLFLLAFLALATFSLIGATEFGTGITHLTTLAMLAALYFVIIDLVDDQASLRTMVLTLITSSALAALVPISQFIISGAERAGGAYLDPNGSALGLVVLVPLAFAFLRSPTSKYNFAFWFVLLLLVGGAFVTTSRGAMIALVVMFALLSMEPLLGTRLRRQIIAVLLILAIMLSCLALFVDKRFTLDSIMSTKGSGRFYIWAAGLNMIQDYWLTGVGLANYKFVYLSYSYLIPGIHPEYRKPLGGHNIFIEIAAEVGIFGILALLGFLLSVLYKSRQLRRAHLIAGNLQQAINCSMLAISIIGLMVASFSLGALYMKVIWLILALSTCQAVRTHRV